MKNKIFTKLIFLITFIVSIANANEFIIESSEIEILNKGEITQARNGVKIISSDGIEITARDLIYNKKKSILKIYGNVKINDKNNNIISHGEEFIYYKNEEKIISNGETKTKIQNEYFLESENLIYERNLSQIYSENKSKIEDLNNNIFFADKFKLNTDTYILKAKNLSLYDNLKNQYYLNFAVVNLKENKFLGSDIFIDFEDSLFGNSQNNPRLKANSMISENNETKMFKGNFTTCNQKDDKCPPWSIHAEEVIHKKKEKKIEYKNAWLKIYNKPVLYFPYFFHPDPTVKRQSGFLMPTFHTSNNSGTSLQIPYYKVISERKDFTFYPRLFFNDEILLQTEYRQANKDSDLILDFSVNKDSDSTKNHLFADLTSKNQNKSIGFHLETVSNDTYLKEKNIKSLILNDNSALHSYINYNSFDNDSSLEVTFEIFENLNKQKSNRYEYIFPNFDYEKNLNDSGEMYGELTLNTRGYNKNYNSNIDESILINDIVLNSFTYADSAIDGLQNNYKLLLRNINSNSDNSTNFRQGEDLKLLSTVIFESSLPLKKENEKFNNYLTPKFAARYSPNSTKNNSNSEKAIVYENIYSLDRIDDTAVEGGESLTLGLEYSSRNKRDEDFLNFSIANILRFNENSDLPKINSTHDKRSDFIGSLEIIPSKFFDLSYKFSLDNKLESSKYDLIKTNININNFVTSFEFLEEDNLLNENSYLKNISKYKFSDNYSISFEASKNLDKNITDYYNLIYEYENDCLTAAIEYNKNYYSDGTLKPDENILFSIKIIPFGKINSPALAK